jgi:tetratricopeptide (TPR) repeat protein
MKAIQQHSLFKDEVEPFTGKVYHLLIKSNYHLAHNQPEKEMKVMEELIAMIDRSTTYGMENPLDYVSIYNRMIGIYKQANSALMFSSIKALTGFGERAHIRKELIQERIYIHCITHELEYYLLNSDYKKIISRLKVIEEELPKLSFEIEKYHLIYYHYLRATAYIFSGHYHKALKGINFALNEFKADNRPSVYVRLLMLNAVVHFELGNYELIERIVKVLYKENSKYPTLTDIELKVCRAIQDVSQSGEVTKSQMIATFNPIHELLQRINKKSGNNTLMRNVEYWVKMRL